MKKFGSGTNSLMYYFVGILFLLAAWVEQSVIYCAISACFMILGVAKSRKPRR